MAKKDKDPAAAAAKKPAKVKEPKKKEVKVKAPPDPIKTRNFIRLLNLLALILAIAAFLLQLFAVLSHHWKWQTTDLHTVIEPSIRSGSSNLPDHALLDQHYGLFSREVKLLADNDEQLDVFTSTRFPRVDDGDDDLHQCLSQTSTLRGAFLTCSSRIPAPTQCHCRRYVYWNVVIVFEILSLVFLGLVVILAVLLATHLQDLLKFAAAGLALLAFILLLIGLILILSHLKRETRSFADAYPHIYRRLTSIFSSSQPSNRGSPSLESALRLPGRYRRADVYRVYSLGAGQYPHNETHFVEFSNEIRDWVYKAYATSGKAVPYAQASPKGQVPPVATASAPAPQLYSGYGPLLGYDRVFDTTRAGIGWSTILSIVAMVLALVVALLLVLSALQAKSLAPKKVDSKTSPSTAYVPLAGEPPVEETVVKIIPSEYDSQRPVGDAVVTTQNIGQMPNVPIVTANLSSLTAGPNDTQVIPPDSVEVRNIIIPGGQTVSNVANEYMIPVAAETIQTIQQS